MSSAENLRAPEGYTYRGAEASDAPALYELDLACRRVDGNQPVYTVATYEQLLQSDTITFAAFDAEERPVGIVWIDVHTVGGRDRIMLEGYVHPDHRRKGLGSYLLGSVERRVRSARQSALHADRPAQLQINSDPLTAGAEAVYRRLGYQRDFAEVVLHRDLSESMPFVSRPENVSLEGWSPDISDLAYRVYQDVWSPRQNTEVWDEQTWTNWVMDDDDFRPDLSFVARQNREVVGYLLTSIEYLPDSDDLKHAWIVQLAVRSIEQRLEISSSLVLRLMAHAHSEGLGEVMVNVDADDDVLLRFYEGLQFRELFRRSRYIKPL